jgi:hypothetical protein
MRKKGASVGLGAIPDSEPLSNHIDQTGITYGPDKLEVFRKACRLRGVGGRAGKRALVKIFDPCGYWTWFVMSWNPRTDECSGLVHGAEKEFGSFSLRELSSVRGPLGIGLEVDTWFLPQEPDASANLR